MRVFNVEDVATAWGVTKETARRWAREGRVPSLKTPTGEYRFTSAALPHEGKAA